MSERSRHSPQLGHVRVRDCMHAGILSCRADTPLGEVAGIMTKHRVHAVAVTNGESQRPIGVLSALDIVTAAASGEHHQQTAGHAAGTEQLTISADARLDRAAQLMSEHSLTHLVVVDSASGYPVGILSTLDIAVVVAEDAER